MNNRWLWLIALIVVNSGWYIVSQQSATQEINRQGAEFSELREAELSSLLGGEVDYEIEHCFESINGGVYNASISVQQGSKTLYSWSGTTDEGCITFSSSAEEGEIIVVTQIEEGTQATASVTTWPIRDAFVIGVVLFSIATFIVAFGESFVRMLIKKKLDEVSLDATNQVQQDQPESNGIWQEPLRPQ